MITIIFHAQLVSLNEENTEKNESFLHSGDFEKWKTQEKVDSFFSDSNKQLRNVIRDKSKEMYCYCRWPNNELESARKIRENSLF